MRRNQSARGKSGDRTHRARDNGYLTHRIGYDLEPRFGKYRLADGTAPTRGALYAAASAFEHAHQRHLVLHGHVFGINAFT